MKREKTITKTVLKTKNTNENKTKKTRMKTTVTSKMMMKKITIIKIDNNEERKLKQRRQ